MGAVRNPSVPLRPLGETDWGELEEFVLSDPDCARTCFDREPSTADVDDVLYSVPDGATVDRRHLTGAFTATGALVGVLHCLTGWPGEASYYIGLLQARPGHRGRGVARSLPGRAEDGPAEAVRAVGRP